MNSSKFRFTLDLHSTQSQYSIPVMLGDTGVTLLISITDGGVPYIITDGCLAKLSIKRPKGTYLEEFCTIKNNAIIEYPFAQNENTCAEEGIHYCDVTLYSPDGEKLGGPRFTMVVSENVVRRDDIELTVDDYTAVDAMVKAEATRQYAENARDTAEKTRKTNENNRTTNEDVRISNEEERNINENDRRLYESERVLNENERRAAENERKSKDAERDAKISGAVNASQKAEQDSAEAYQRAGYAYDIAQGALNFSEQAYDTAIEAKNQSNATRTSLINLSAQVQGIGRTYVIPTFLEFIDFLNDQYEVILREDRDGNGVNELYRIGVTDLKSGDNIIITEKGVPDFWLEKNAALTEFETYTYNGIEYPLGAIVGGVVIGGAHILETDYSVIEGHALSAAASANEARGYAFDAGMAKTNAEEAAAESETARARAVEAANLAVDVLSNASNALKGKKSGGIVAMSDISPLEHTLDVRVRSKNLIPYPYANSTVERYGITYTDHGDGTVTANGTATQQSWFLLYREVLQPGDYFFKGTPQNAAAYVYVANSDYTLYKTDRGAGVAFSIATETLISISINVESGKTVVNELYKPMLTIGAVATDEHTPYIPDISAVKVKKLGKNLIPYPYANTTRTENGVTFTDNGDGSITINGTPTTDTGFMLRSAANPIVLDAGSYRMGINADKQTNASAYASTASGLTISSNANVATNITERTSTTYISIIAKGGTTYDDVTVSPQLEIGTAATEHEPYIEPVEYAVNEDGTVDGVTSIYPTTTLLTDTAGAVIDVEYNRDINKAFAELYNAIISLGGNV